MSGRAALLTGATSGIGRALAFDLAAHGWRLLLHGRNSGKCEELAADLAERGHHNFEFYVADFRRLGDTVAMIKRICAEGQTVDVLINNAGTGFTEGPQTTEDGFDETIQVNYLAPYLLTVGLRPLLAANSPSCILNVVSLAQLPMEELSFAPGAKPAISYAQSKLALIMISRHLQPWLRAQGISVLCAHPGSMIPSSLSRRLSAGLPEEAQAALHSRYGHRISAERAANYLAAALDNPAGALHAESFIANGEDALLHPAARDSVGCARLSAATQRQLNSQIAELRRDRDCWPAPPAKLRGAEI